MHVVIKKVSYKIFFLLSFKIHSFVMRFLVNIHSEFVTMVIAENLEKHFFITLAGVS